MLKIIIHPNKHLRLKSESVSVSEILSDNFRDFLNELGTTMLQEDGAGLAAPQVDVQKRVVVVNMDGAGKSKAFINPKISRKSLTKNILEEGCLSIPGVFDKVKRQKNITVKYQDEKGDWHKQKCDEYLSRVLQHEIDHLDGVLFIDKIIKNK